MKQMTKAKRHEIYKRAYKRNIHINGKDMLFRFLNLFCDMSLRHERELNFPELYIFDCQIYEFSIKEYKKMRAIALLFCIEMTRP